MDTPPPPVIAGLSPLDIGRIIYRDRTTVCRIIRRLKLAPCAQFNRYKFYHSSVVPLIKAQLKSTSSH